MTGDAERYRARPGPRRGALHRLWSPARRRSVVGARRDDGGEHDETHDPRPVERMSAALGEVDREGREGTARGTARRLHAPRCQCPRYRGPRRRLVSLQAHPSMSLIGCGLEPSRRSMGYATPQRPNARCRPSQVHRASQRARAPTCSASRRPKYTETSPPRESTSGVEPRCTTSSAARCGRSKGFTDLRIGAAARQVRGRLGAIRVLLIYLILLRFSLDNRRFSIHPLRYV